MKRKNQDNKGYPEFEQLNLPAMEKEILRFWEENGIFEKSITERPEDKRFVFYEGPPSANGKPGITQYIFFPVCSDGFPNPFLFHHPVLF